MSSTATQSTRARSLYRRLLRELPSRSPSILANPSPIQNHIRTNFFHQTAQQKSTPVMLQDAEQYTQYLKAQRLYTTLLER